MANTSRVRGFKPLRYLNGAKWNGMANMYYVPSSDGTAIFVGDAVKLAGSAGSAGTVVNGQDVEGMPTIAQAAATDVVVGVVVGFLPKQTDLSKIYREASTDRIALVVDDPNVVFEVEEDGVGNTIANTMIGENADIVVGSGSTTTGQSGMMLDSSTHATTATLQLKILGLVKRVDNALGASAKIEVLLNKHTYGMAGTGRVGV